MPALTALSAATSATGTVVMTSATGSYDIDSVNGVIHIIMNPPLNVQNGGPNDAGTYTVRGQEGVDARAFVGTIYVGTTSTGMARYSYNMTREEQEGAD